MMTLEQLAAREAIRDVVIRYARAIDRMDEDLLRSVFHPGSVHNHFYEGPSSDPGAPSTAAAPGDFVAFALTFLGTCRQTHHQLGNILIEFDGDAAADVETYFTAYHRMRAKGDPLAGEGAFDSEMDWLVGGRYVDRFECRDGLWKITRRAGLTDWMRLEAPCSQGMADLPAAMVGQRAPDDFIYGRN
jgi:hypothetical protein